MKKNHTTISIKVFPALNGDSLLISYGKTDRKHILLDCGYPNTYYKYIQQELQSIKNAGECLEKLIITHIDSDHISGAIPLLSDSTLNLEIKEIWHNTYRHLNFDESERNNENSGINSILEADIIRRGYKKAVLKSGELPLSSKQGTTVGALILKNRYNWNTDFDGNAVSLDNRNFVEIDEYSCINLLSPNNKKLEALKQFWISELKKFDLKFSGSNNKNYDDAFEMLLSWEKESVSKQQKPINNATVESLSAKPPTTDKTVTNGSSIAFVLEANERKLLLLGDAHPDIIMSSLNKYASGAKIVFDIIKVSHHGSYSNISNDLLQIMDSPVYVFSSNGGKHDHPDKETIACIINRNTNFKRKLFFNYLTKTSHFFDRSDWMLKYNYSIHYLNDTDFTINI
jgi:beta-lactamase superfamily II metal-dependent hydrolase